MPTRRSGASPPSSARPASKRRGGALASAGRGAYQCVMFLRLLLVSVLVLLVVSWLTRSPKARRAIWIVMIAIAVYGVLKATGVIDAIAPARDGFGVF